MLLNQIQMKEDQSLQFKELVLKSHKILLTTKARHTGDGLASVLALAEILKKFNKNAEIIIDGFRVPENFSFMQGIEKIKDKAASLAKSTLSVNIAQTGLEDLSYDIKGSDLKIYLSPRSGQFEVEDFKLENGEFAYDLIICADCPELEALGGLYDHHRDLFFRVPLVNIDHQLANEQYGHLNIIDVTASSVAEIIFDLVQTLLPEEIDSAIATCLLTGLIDKTKSFKGPRVSPKALKIASDLMSLGANRKQIVEQLYQTKTISMIKLWGRILSRLNFDESLKLVWSKADLNDFTESGAGPADAAGLLEDIMAYSPGAEVIVLLYQTGANEAKAITRSQSSISALSLAKIFEPSGDKTQASFNVAGQSLAEMEAKVIGEIKRQLTFFKAGLKIRLF